MARGHGHIERTGGRQDGTILPDLDPPQLASIPVGGGYADHR